MRDSVRTSERRLLLPLDTDIASLCWTEDTERLYVGLWANRPQAQTVLAYKFVAGQRPELEWTAATGDIVRSIRVVRDQGGGHLVLAASENGILLSPA